MRMYALAYGCTKEYAEQLKRGIEKLPEFAAHICGFCEGRGEYEQIYNIGCGMGYYQSLGVCDWCDGTGVRQGNCAASDSVVYQLLEAGK